MEYRDDGSGDLTSGSRPTNLGLDVTAAPPLSWQKLRAARRTAEARWPSPFRLPLVHRPTDVLYAGLTGSERVLDVGAGDATRRERVKARFPGVTYVSCDPDAEARADHATPSDAPGSYDVATLFEVIEHLPPEAAVALLAEVRAKLVAGGRVVVSVPCTHTPGRWQKDCTHVTPWAHDEAVAALVLAGFEPEAVFRTYPGSAVARAVRIALLGPVGRVFGLDYAHSVVVTGRA